MIHKAIKEQIKDALRARDTITLDTLRGLNALFMNEMLASGFKDEFLPDDKVLTLIKRSIKQHKDSIEQFEKGGRDDLVSKEKAELKILEAFMPAAMTADEIRLVARARINTIKSGGAIDPKSSGKIVGMIMKELAGKADGNEVRKIVEELLGLPK